MSNYDIKKIAVKPQKTSIKFVYRIYNNVSKKNELLFLLTLISN